MRSAVPAAGSRWRAPRATPFEALSLPVGVHSGDLNHSPVLEAWGVDLYDTVADDLRPVVLQLALAAACSRPKRDA